MKHLHSFVQRPKNPCAGKKFIPGNLRNVNVVVHVKFLQQKSTYASVIQSGMV